MGKTVISLALILANPAPTIPESGSSIQAVPDLDESAQGSFWEPNLKTNSETKEHCSIISRGTLVVVRHDFHLFVCHRNRVITWFLNPNKISLFQCNVSLVGQWVEEARSKLTNPGLVYPYHGGSRKRAPEILVKNSIVVTTYETLASDFRIWQKRGDEYIPPCERIRWWRIICDESHGLRDPSTTKHRALMHLTADHKWLVSGKRHLSKIDPQYVTYLFLPILLCLCRHTGANVHSRSPRPVTISWPRRCKRDDGSFSDPSAK